MNKHSKIASKIVMLTTSPNPDDEQKAKQINKIIAFKRKPLTKNIFRITCNKLNAKH
jgi:hypothetical protein